MRKQVLSSLSALAFCLAPLTSLAINDIEPGKEFYTVVYAPNPIVLDGDLSEWSGVPVIADPKSAIPKFSGTNANPNYVLFEEFNGGTWGGADDQNSAGLIVSDTGKEKGKRHACNTVHATNPFDSFSLEKKKTYTQST